MPSILLSILHLFSRICKVRNEGYSLLTCRSNLKIFTDLTILLLDSFDVYFDFDVVADEHSACLKRNVPVEVEVFAVDLGVGCESKHLRAPGAGVEAFEVGIEYNFFGDVADR